MASAIFFATEARSRASWMGRWAWSRVALAWVITASCTWVMVVMAWVVIWVGINVIGNHAAFFSRDSIYGVPAKLMELILLYLLWRDKP